MNNGYFHKKEIERYSRQILFIGKEKQKKIKETKVTVIGCGGISSSLVMYLVASGVGQINIIEFDSIESSNLGRQILFREEDISLSKGAVAQNFLQSMNPYVTVNWIPEKANYETLLRYANFTDILLETSDSIDMKYIANEFSIKNNIPVIIGAVSPKQSHVFPFTSIQNSAKPKIACYECIFPKPKDSSTLPNCSTTGILSVVPGLIGNIMAYLCVQYIVHNYLESVLYVVDELQIRTIPLQYNKECKICL